MFEAEPNSSRIDGLQETFSSSQAGPALATSRFSELGTAFEKLRLGEGVVKSMAQHLLELAFRDLTYKFAGGLIVPQLGTDAGQEQEFVAAPTNTPRLPIELSSQLNLLWREAKNDDETVREYFQSNGQYIIAYVPIKYGYDNAIGFFFSVVTKLDEQNALARLRYISKHIATSMQAEKAAHALDHLAEAIAVASVTTEEVAERVAAAALSGLNCSAVVVWRLENRTRLRTIAAVGTGQGLTLDMRSDQGVAGRCAVTCQTVSVNDLLDANELIAKDVGNVYHPLIVSEKSWRTAIFVPLNIGGEAAGVLAAYGSRPRGFSKIDQTIAQAFAQRLSAGYAHAARIQHLQTMEAKINIEADAIEAGLLALENVHDAINDLGGAQNELNHIKRDFSTRLPPKVLQRLRDCALQLSQGADKIKILANRSKFRQFIYRPTPVKELLESCIESVRSLAAGSKIGIHLTCPRELVMQIDRDKVARVILNFLYNSIYFLKHDNKGQEKYIKLTVVHLAKDRVISFKFWDNGLGIAESHLDQVFDYFFTTKGDRGLVS